jgi:hypothetical protein
VDLTQSVAIDNFVELCVSRERRLKHLKVDAFRLQCTGVFNDLRDVKEFDRWKEVAYRDQRFSEVVNLIVIKHRFFVKLAIKHENAVKLAELG